MNDQFKGPHGERMSEALLATLSDFEDPTDSLLNLNKPPKTDGPHTMLPAGISHEKEAPCSSDIRKMSISTRSSVRLSRPSFPGPFSASGSECSPSPTMSDKDPKEGGLLYEGTSSMQTQRRLPIETSSGGRSDVKKGQDLTSILAKMEALRVRVEREVQLGSEPDLSRSGPPSFDLADLSMIRNFEGSDFMITSKDALTKFYQCPWFSQSFFFTNLNLYWDHLGPEFLAHVSNDTKMIRSDQEMSDYGTKNEWLIKLMINQLEHSLKMDIPAAAAALQGATANLSNHSELFSHSLQSALETLAENSKTQLTISGKLQDLLLSLTTPKPHQEPEKVPGKPPVLQQENKIICDILGVASTLFMTNEGKLRITAANTTIHSDARLPSILKAIKGQWTNLLKAYKQGDARAIQEYIAKLEGYYTN